MELNSKVIAQHIPGMGIIIILKHFFLKSALQERLCKVHFLDVGQQKHLALIMLIHSKRERLAPMTLVEKLTAEKCSFLLGVDFLRLYCSRWGWI